jgi:hypothetical protein
MPRLDCTRTWLAIEQYEPDYLSGAHGGNLFGAH